MTCSRPEYRAMSMEPQDRLFSRRQGMRPYTPDPQWLGGRAGVQKFQPPAYTRDPFHQAEACHMRRPRSVGGCKVNTSFRPPSFSTVPAADAESCFRQFRGRPPAGMHLGVKPPQEGPRKPRMALNPEDRERARERLYAACINGESRGGCGIEGRRAIENVQLFKWYPTNSRTQRISPRGIPVRPRMHD